MHSNTEAKSMCLKSLLPVVCLFTTVSAWGSSSSSVDSSVYGNALSRDWLYDGSSVSLKLEGCAWGSVGDNEDSGCMDQSSEDGTTYWYQMANCRRPQAVFDIYSGSGCSSFKESFVTRNGLSEFMYYLQNSQNGNDDGNEYNDWSYDNLPMCEQSNGNYVGLGCADDGSFALLYFSDQYCMEPTGSTYDRLRSLNNKLKSYKSCTSIYKADSGNGNSAAASLVANSDSCSSLDSGMCTDNSSMKSRRSHTSRSRQFPGAGTLAAHKTWVTKLKYVVAGLLLLASFIMFTGILFTNRRRRRALMQRKYKQSSSKSKKSKSRSSRSKSKSDRSSKERSSSRRSKPRTREEEEEGGGVFT